MTCPECGHTSRREKELHRTRRRLLPALLSAFVAALGATWTIEQAQQRGWMSLMPTGAIVLALPVAGTFDDLNAELSRRIGNRILTEGQWRMLIKRCLAGDRNARPVSERWETKYGRLLERSRTVLPKEFELDRILLDLPARVELTSARSWPRDAPVCLTLDVRHWWPQDTTCRVTLNPAFDGAPPITVFRGGNTRNDSAFPVVVENTTESPLVFDMVLERRPPGTKSTWEQVESRRIEVPVEIDDSTLVDTIEAVADERLDEALRATFSHGVVKWTSGRSPVRVRYDPRPTFGLVTDTAIGVIIELLRDGVPARRLDIWWSLHPDRDRQDFGWEVVHEDVPTLLSATEADGRWKMRVRGDAATALRAGPAGRYWAGEFTIPMSIDDRDVPAPPKGWWREENATKRD